MRSNLNCDAIDSRPVNIDWREAYGENCDGFEVYDSCQCSECGDVVVGRGERDNDQTHGAYLKDRGEGDVEECPKCGDLSAFESVELIEKKDGTLKRAAADDRDTISGYWCRKKDGGCGHLWRDPQACEGYLSFSDPMMNYYYPVDLKDCEEAARKLAGDFPLCVVQLRDGTTGLALTGGGRDFSWEICGAFVRLGYYPPVHFAGLRDQCKSLSKGNLTLIHACGESARIAANWALGARSTLANTVRAMRNRVLCKNCGRRRSEHADKKCLFEPTSWER